MLTQDESLLIDFLLISIKLNIFVRASSMHDDVGIEDVHEYLGLVTQHPYVIDGFVAELLKFLLGAVMEFTENGQFHQPYEHQPALSRRTVPCQQ